MARPKKVVIDPAEHLGMLHHVVHSPSLGIPFELRDEAVSEGMVLLVQAAQSFDAKHGVPPHYWIAKKLRWGLLNWKLREIAKQGQNQTYDYTCNIHDNGHPASEDLEAYQPDWATIREIREILELCAQTLPDDIYLALIGPALGLQMKELSHALKANPMQIQALQTKGRKIVQEMRLL